ncbi:hypothetical protein PHMEG_00010664 [Phytophthora megakarya]|uniref:MULE transposase domain-containing protein n=1 Tax=Phytophthora megakarya TaxID=4795 RepID=A0A225WFM8_9STRA|nr:hypothetical protein PHMEG_00010664 [Phytophthora megakarya]
MEAGKIDLKKKYGRHDIQLHDVFTTVTSSTEFLRAYAFNENKPIEKANHSGNLGVLKCTSGLCDWNVALTKKRPTKRVNTKLEFCPTDSWFVSALNLVHGPSCNSVRKCTSKLLLELPGFKSAMVKGLSCARARVASSVKVTDNVNVYNRPSLVWTVSDDFFRAFLAFGSLIAGQDNWIPILECDRMHMKNVVYNGVRLLRIGKDSDWGTFPVAVAFVNKETADNFEWFFASCIVAGIDMYGRPLFADRGKQRDAQVRLRLVGVHVHLKFRVLHIFFNVCSHFRPIEPNIASIRSLIIALQSTTTLVEYEAVLSAIDEQFPSKRTIEANGKLETQSGVQYLRLIHPLSWTNFGNDKLTHDEELAVCAEWSSVDSFGDSCPLFGGRSTSAIESQNRALLLAGV